MIFLFFSCEMSSGVYNAFASMVIKNEQNDYLFLGFEGPVESYKLIELLLFAELHKRHQQESENLTITTQPFRTLKFFVLAVFQYIKSSISYLLAKGGWLMLLSTMAIAVGILVVTIDGPHEKVFFFVNSHCGFNFQQQVNVMYGLQNLCECSSEFLLLIFLLVVCI